MFSRLFGELCFEEGAMGVARGRCWAAGVVTGVLAVVPSTSADPSSVAGGASVSSGGVVQAPSAGSPSSSPSVSDGLGVNSSSSWPAGMPDPSSWLRNVKVSDVGAHTADVSFDWDLSYLLNGKKNGTYKDEYGGGKWVVDYSGGGANSPWYGAAVDPAKDVDGVCFTIGVGRATSITPVSGDRYEMSYSQLCGDSDPTSPYTGVADSKMTPEDYQRIHGTHTSKLYQGGKVTGQSFDRYEYGSFAEMGAKPGEWKGHYDMALIGLDSNTLYGNTKDTLVGAYQGVDYDFGWGANSYWQAAEETAADLYDKGVRTATKVDIRGLRLGVAVHLKDSSKAVQQCKADKHTTNKSGCNIVFPNVYGEEMPSALRGYVDAVVPDFRTGVEPVVPSSVSGLPVSVKGGVSVDASVVRQGSVARFYVDGLKAAARGKADASSLFWYAYIYSSPQRLSGPDGAPYVTVRKASDGRYYFDAIVPAGLKAGSHTVSLTDANGHCQGWTPVTVTAASTAVMYRLYNKYTGEHFYTSSSVERDSLVKVGWRSEGTGWVAPVSGAPVYRLYNPYVAGGDHHYTMSVRERDALVKAGWRSEGVGWYSGGTVKVLREYNPYARTGTHNYTTDAREDTALVKAGWRAEGTGWYAVKAK